MDACSSRIRIILEIKQEKVTSPGICRVHRGQSRKAHREYHRGLCLSPALGNPSPGESRRAHMAYLEKKIQKQPALGIAGLTHIRDVPGNPSLFQFQINLNFLTFKLPFPNTCLFRLRIKLRHFSHCKKTSQELTALHLLLKKAKRTAGQHQEQLIVISLSAVAKGNIL